MTTLLEASWDQWEAGVRKQGLERGRAEQGVRLLARLAALKFGAGGGAPGGSAGRPAGGGGFGAGGRLDHRMRRGG